MVTPDIITSQTNAALREAAAKYSATIAIPCFVKDVDGFALAYLGKEEEPSLSTLVTGTPDSLAISVESDESETQAFVNIDLRVPGNSPASIVAPGFYNENGERDVDNGTLQRPVVRPLTELEGRGLTMDLYSLLAKIPEVRRRS